MVAKLNRLYERLRRVEPGEDRPFVTLAFAQSLDGSIAAQPGVRTNISGEASLVMTHTLRTLHDAILIGIGTVLADDPRLTTRAVDGPNPQPVVVDSRLRLPPDCQLLRGEKSPWIACLPASEAGKRNHLQSQGATLLAVPGEANQGLDLGQLLGELRARGVRRLMVEGGARIIRSFLQTNLVDLIVITIAPHLLSGLWPYELQARSQVLPVLADPHWAQAGDDVILWADVERA